MAGVCLTSVTYEPNMLSGTVHALQVISTAPSTLELAVVYHPVIATDNAYFEMKIQLVHTKL